MSEFRKFSPTRTLIKLDEISPYYGDTVIVCLPVDALIVARKLLSERGTWRTTFVRDYVADIGYNIPNDNDADYVEYLSSVADFIKAEDMTCDILSGLQEIARAIGANSCCGSTGTLIEIDGGFYFGTEAPAEAPTTFGGENDIFATESEYNAHRCDVATEIATGLYNALTTLSTFSLINLTGVSSLVGLVYLGVLSIPPVAIISAAVVAGVSTGLLVTAREAIDYDEIKCIVFNNDTATEIYDAIKDNVAEKLVVDFGALEIEASAIINVIMSMIDINAINKVFTAYKVTTGGSDCSDCAGQTDGCDWSIAYGSYVWDGTKYEWSGEYVPAQNAYYVELVPDGWRNITVSNLTGWTNNAGWNDFRLWEFGSTSVVYSGDTMPSGPVCCGKIIFTSATPFSFEMECGDNSGCEE